MQELSQIINSTASLEEMVKAGVHLGHTASKWHPKMKPYIHSTKHNIHIINLEKTQEQLQIVLGFMTKKIIEGEDILFVSTRKQAVNIVKATAEEVGMPYVVNRWIGGIFTNYKVVSARIKKLTDLEQKLLSNQLEGYTKKELLMFQEKVNKGNKLFGGIKGMNRMPAAVFVQDLHKDILAIKEAKAAKIPVIGFVDTNMNPNLVDFVIPANDDAVSSINLMYSLIKQTVIEAKKQVPAKEIKPSA